MAVIYLRSTDGDDGSDGSSWANAKATLAAALTAAGAGGTVYVSDNHAESQASAMTLTSPGTAASPTVVLCVDDSAEPPVALATTATVSTTTGAMSFAGFAYFYGLTFACGVGQTSEYRIQFVSTSPWWMRLENCTLNNALNRTNAPISVGVVSSGIDDNLLELIGCAVQFGNAAQWIDLNARLLWRGGSAAASGTVPTTLFKPGAMAAAAVISGVDLSALGSGKNLVDVSLGTKADVLLENCKLGASVAVATGNIAGQGAAAVRVVNCDSADTNYRYHRQTYQGAITQETTIVRTGGASDGTTPISRKMVTTAGSQFYAPLESDPIVLWNETLSELTATVEVVTDGVTLTDAEAWIEVEYLGTSGYPQSVRASDRAATILSTPANQAASTETWTTTGLASPVRQKLSVAFTPAEKGPVKVRVMLAKASTTMYFDPQAGLTSGREYQAGESYLNEPAAGGGGGAHGVIGSDIILGGRRAA